MPLTSTPRSRWIWRALVGGLILGLPAGALLFVRVPVLTVIDVKAERRILALQVRAGDSVVLSSRDSLTQDLLSRTFEVESDGSLLVRETTARPSGPVRTESRLQGAGGERLRELSVFVSPLTEHTLVVKGQALSLSRTLRPGSLVKIRVERQFWWRQAVRGRS